MAEELIGELSGISEIIVELSETSELEGELSGSSELTGELAGISELTGELSGISELSGDLSIPNSSGKPYRGSYEVFPTDGFQILDTEDRLLEEDILVHPVRYQEVSNIYGGLTVTIGE